MFLKSSGRNCPAAASLVSGLFFPNRPTRQRSSFFGLFWDNGRCHATGIGQFYSAIMNLSRCHKIYQAKHKPTKRIQLKKLSSSYDERPLVLEAGMQPHPQKF